jgi:CheY-like chemotaxis protein/HPt (histidine-containing phosphotransfer) domain-containing protein
MLVRALGGEIELASAPGKGTRMSFSILAQTPPAATAPLAAAISAPLAMRSLRVMVVEDNDVNRELLGIMLEQLGHQVCAVADGEAAISRCEDEAFDAVLMDLNLPRIGGIEATRRILNDPIAKADRRPAIIALTASVSDADRALCAAAGMRGFLTKPATVFSIDVALRSALNDALAEAVVPVERHDLLDEITLDSLAELDLRASEPFLRRLIEQFLDGLPRQVAQMQSQWEANEGDAIFATAHSLAGAAAAIGGSALARAARRVSEEPSSATVEEAETVSHETATALKSWAARRLPAATG